MVDYTVPDGDRKRSEANSLPPRTQGWHRESEWITGIAAIAPLEQSSREGTVQNPFLIGSKIYLRPLDLADAPILTTWMNDPEVTKYLLKRPPDAVRRGSMASPI